MVRRAHGAALPDHEAESVADVVAFHEEHYRAFSAPQRVIDAITNTLGRPATLLVIVLGLLLWALAAAVISGGAVDEPVFAWLEFSATAAALLIAMLILVTQRHEDELAERRARLILELSLLADRRAAKIIELLEEQRRDQPGLANRDDPESEAMASPTDPETLVAAIDAKTRGRRGPTR